jgi:hypothetical protein
MPRETHDRPPRPPSRFTGALLIGFLVVGALAGVFVGLRDINAESKVGNPIHCGGAAFSILISGSDTIVPTGTGARGKYAQHICWRDAQQMSAIAGAVIVVPFVVVLVFARRRGRSAERL